MRKANLAAACYLGWALLAIALGALWWVQETARHNSQAAVSWRTAYTRCMLARDLPGLGWNLYDVDTVTRRPDGVRTISWEYRRSDR